MHDKRRFFVLLYDRAISNNNLELNKACYQAELDYNILYRSS